MPSRVTAALDEKPALRLAAKSRRREAHEAVPDAGRRVAENLAILGPMTAGKAVSGYWPMGDELDPLPALRCFKTLGATICFPVVKKGEPLTFRVADPSGPPPAPGVLKIPAPGPDAPLVEPLIVLVPLLAFDRRGTRLGIGGGYYDRTLAALRAKRTILAVGVAYAAQEFPSLPRREWDQSLDWVVTEREAIGIS